MTSRNDSLCFCLNKITDILQTRFTRKSLEIKSFQLKKLGDFCQRAELSSMLMLSWFCRSRNCWKEFQRINAVPRTQPKYMYYTQMLTLNKMIAVFLPTSISRTPHLKDITDPIKSGLSPESCKHQLWLYFHFMLQSPYISKTLQLFNSTDNRSF